MTIEAHLKSIDASLSTIALTLSAIAEGTGAAIPPSEGTSSAAPQETAAAKKKAAAAKKKAEAAASKKEEEPDGPKLEDVRSALTAVQAATSGKDARELLAKVGGNGTLGKVKPAKYQAVIDAAQELLAKVDEENG